VLSLSLSLSLPHHRVAARWRRAAYDGAQSIRRRGPSGPPQLGSLKTTSSIWFLWNAASYSSRSRLRSQPPRSMTKDYLESATRSRHTLLYHLSSHGRSRAIHKDFPVLPRCLLRGTCGSIRYRLGERRGIRVSTRRTRSLSGKRTESNHAAPSGNRRAEPAGESLPACYPPSGHVPGLTLSHL
jgi:hypothetical protein